MHFTQPSNPFFYRVQVITDRARVAHFPIAPSLSLPAVVGYPRDDTVFVDIQSKIEFFFHWCVCLFDLLKLQRSGTLCPGRWCGSAPPQKGE
jgi:hypothetical protein